MRCLSLSVLLWGRDTLTESTHERKDLTGGWVIVSEGQSVIITAGSMAAGALSESYILRCKQQAERDAGPLEISQGFNNSMCHGLLKPYKAIPPDLSHLVPLTDDATFNI